MNGPFYKAQRIQAQNVNRMLVHEMYFLQHITQSSLSGICKAEVF